MENICRSPLAEGVLRHHLRRAGKGGEVAVNSAGTRASQRGARPDQRAQRVAAAAGVSLGSIRARKVTEKLLVEADFVFSMDHSNLKKLMDICPPEHRHKISLLLSQLPGQEQQDVPDPYYGNYRGFEQVYELIEGAVLNLVSNQFLGDARRDI